MTDQEAAEMFRADAIAAGLPPHYDPNTIAFALHDWLASVPEFPRPALARGLVPSNRLRDRHR